MAYAYFHRTFLAALSGVFLKKGNQISHARCLPGRPDEFVKNIAPKNVALHIHTYIFVKINA
jgi:hypothetical protein